MEIDFFLIVFIIQVFIMLVLFPVAGLYDRKKLNASHGTDDNYKIRFYQTTIYWLWVPVLLIVLLLLFSDVSLENIGLKWIDFQSTSMSNWIVYPTVVSYFIYLIYNMYLIFILKKNRDLRKKAAENITDEMKIFLPVSKKERGLWTWVSISAGIAEENLYRGYFFYALAVFFPQLSLFYILLISTAVFGVGHIYLGKEAIKSTFLGLLFGFYYIVFDSIFPVIIIHIVQDLVVKDLLQDGGDTS